MAAKGSSADKTEARLNDRVSGEYFFGFFCILKSLIKKFSLLRSTMTLYPELQHKQLHVNIITRLQLRPSLHTAINHQKLCLSKDGGTNC